jgi:hypothetical protein
VLCPPSAPSASHAAHHPSAKTTAHATTKATTHTTTTTTATVIGISTAKDEPNPPTAASSVMSSATHGHYSLLRLLPRPNPWR